MTTELPRQWGSKNNYFTEIKHTVLSSFPTTVRRSVCLENFISVDHSVNRWLYERWVSNATVERELLMLHREMKQKIINHSNNNNLEVAFVHLDPRTITHSR